MIYRTYLMALLALGLTACDNELDVTAPWQDIPIVYGILSPQDTATYIRVEKAFLDPNTSALDIARIPDSLYYDEVEVTIVDVQRDERIQLNEVNGDLEGLVRDEGVFAESPNILYKAPPSELELRPGANYRVEVNRGDELPMVFAEVEQVGAVLIRRPAEGEQLRFVYDREFRILWEDAEGAAFNDVTMIIRYDEGLAGDPDSFEETFVEWPISRNSQESSAEVFGIQFYEFMADAIEEDPEVERIFRSIDCLVRSGGQELLDFRRILQANTGITGAGGELPQFTNISEGVGIVTTSNNDRVDDLILNPVSLDSLRNGVITRDLNFR